MGAHNISDSMGNNGYMLVCQFAYVMTQYRSV